MVVSLLNLGDGHLSLEFDRAEIEAVTAVLRRLFGTLKVVRYPEITTYAWAGVSLIYQNQWDDPCLISGCDKGDAMLERVAELLGPASEVAGS